MRHTYRLVCALGVAAMCVPGCGGAATLDSSEAAPSTSHVVRLWAYERLQRAQAGLEAEDTERAEAALEEMQSHEEELTPHERALLWQTVGHLEVAQGAPGRAADALDKALSFNALPDEAVVDTLYNLGVVSLEAEQHRRAADALERWVQRARRPTQDALQNVAIALLRASEPEAALRHARRALRTASAPTERGLELILRIHYERDDQRAMLTTLERLIEHFPRKRYWLELSAAYSELGDSERALAALELAHLQGLLNASEQVTLARHYLQEHIPFKAARLLDANLRSGRIPSTSAHRELVAYSWLDAGDRDRGLSWLYQAAEAEDTAELFIQIGRIEMAREQWQQAASALRRALPKADEAERSEAQLLLGISHFHRGERGAARRALRAAKDHPATQNEASQWLRLLAHSS